MLLVTCRAIAATHYVDALNPAPAAPFTSWATAATNIQDAVDAAVAGDEIVVTNGIYSSGGRAVFGLMTNRVAVDRPLNLRSVNGPQFTTIVGYQVPGTTNGDGAIRCVYLTNGASLVGFTLYNGATRLGAGDTVHENSGGGVWCESWSAIVSNCVVTACSATANGVAYGGSLYDCTLVKNDAAAAAAFLSNCVVVQNWGGSIYQCTAYHCVINTNGYGATDCNVNASVISGNNGPGVAISRVSNSLIVNNFGASHGNAFFSTLTNCTLVADPTNALAALVESSTLDNCVLYNIFSSGSTLNYCCRWPYTSAVTGSNFSLNPEFVDPVGGDFRLKSSSPCINAGNNIYVQGIVDADLHPRLFGPTVDIGAYEFQGAPTPTAPYFLTQPQPTSLSVYAGTNVTYSPLAYGTQPTYQWFFGGNPLSGATTNPLTLTNVQVNQSGIYYLNVSNSAGQANSSNVSLTVYPAPVAGTHYVNPNNAAPTFPYTNWTTAATNIQNAIIAAQPGDQIIVTNGIYASGDQDGSRVNIDRAVTVRSVNGAPWTVIDGAGQVRGVNMANGSSLIGFTVTNGYAGTAAGVSAGFFFSNTLVQNCVLVGNRTPQGGGFGGGVAGGMLNNCLIVGNSSYQGGGVYYSSMNNCTVVSNTATYEGGGIWSTNGQLNNCIIYYNNAPYGSNWSGSGFRTGPAEHVYCCTVPAQYLDITNAPQFVDPTSGNYRLQPGSPCVNAGTNFYVVGSTDLDGRPRIIGPAVDIGAYEFQTNLFLTAVLQGPAGVRITVHGQPGSTCTLFVSSNLSSWTPLTQVTCAVSDGTAVVNDSPGANFSRRFYRAVSP